MLDVQIYSDGGARGNPGPAAAAAIILSKENVVYQQGLYVGEATNNQAEYIAATLPYEFLLTNKHLLAGQVKSVTHHLDSELIVNQLNGLYRLKDSLLKLHAQNILSLIKKLSIPATFVYIPRTQNSKADALVNQTLDRVLGVI
jgi:ribonuclease HI